MSRPRSRLALLLEGDESFQDNLAALARTPAPLARGDFAGLIGKSSVGVGEIAVLPEGRGLDASKGANDIVSPGHVFPLTARDGGTLVRAGHTEASVDISRAAGLNPSAVICEIMNDDGTMARLPELIAFAQFHNLKIGAIDELIAWRRVHERLVEKVAEAPFETRAGSGFKVVVFRNKLDGVEHVALVKGAISALRSACLVTTEPNGMPLSVAVRMNGWRMTSTIDWRIMEMR